MTDAPAFVFEEEQGPTPEELRNLEEMQAEEDQDPEPEKERSLDYETVNLYMKEVAKCRLLSRDEEAALAVAAAAGDEAARSRMIEANLRLVINIAMCYTGNGLPLSDLIQEGNIGLMKAVERYDLTLGYRLTTYADWWIRRSITSAIYNQGRTIRLPEGKVRMIHRIERVTRRLQQNLRREPDAEEIAAELGLPAEKVRELQWIAQRPLSLDAPLAAGGHAVLADLIRAEDALAPEEVTKEALLKEQIRKALDTLTPREKRVLELRFGLNDEERRTLEEIGREYGISRERVRQIEAKAIRKLRRPACAVMLQDFLT